MSMSYPLLGPVIALVAWSMIMLIWMYATRLPAVFKAKMKMEPTAIRGEQMSLLPANVRWKADNYMHLMEQPTIFYALAICLAIMGVSDSFSVSVAWVYVLLRIIHSLVQAITNKIELRFLIFILSNVPLFILTIQAALLHFS